ncbi:hypothetical protein NDU88_005611 [Pleurodeles waltl]|uniref:Uncharacterized protein n=1 Tax=Pleurodeles waltl TaxID=8319 RepID=A0AAV7QF85_PLEWA|nr:hypothetical protein NDU88_005611 [Pleurodeles waltl]
MGPYSRYPEVELVLSTAAHVAILKMEKLMATHGLFGELRTDSGPPFNSHKWADFLEVQKHSSPPDHASVASSQLRGGKVDEKTVQNDPHRYSGILKC